MPSQTPVLRDSDQNDKLVFNLAGIAADAAAVKIFKVPTSGMYQVSCYYVCTTTGEDDVAPALTIGFEDETGANSILPAKPSAATEGISGTSTSAIYCVADSFISYLLGSGTFTAGAVFSLHLVITKL